MTVEEISERRLMILGDCEVFVLELGRCEVETGKYILLNGNTETIDERMN